MVDFRDTPTDFITKFISERYVSLRDYVIGHGGQHLPGGEQPIPLVTTTAAGLMRSADKVMLDALAASDVQTLVPKPISITLSASNAITPLSNSATVDQLNAELAGNTFPIVYGLYQAGAFRTVERLNWMARLPAGAGAYSVTAQIEGMIGTDETHTSTYLLKMVRVPDGGNYNVTIPTVATITVSYSTAYKKYLSTVSAPFVITGLGDTILCEITRGTAGDNLTINSLFCNCFLQFAENTIPVVDFIASDYTATVGDTITFTDLSTNTPTSWVWCLIFNGGVNDGLANYYYTQNPTTMPLFDNFGVDYTITVSLYATNADGTGFLQRVAFITVSATPPVVGDPYGAGTEVDTDTIGGGAGYSDIKITGTHVITSTSDFVDHMSGGAQAAVSGDIVFIPATLTIDLTGLPELTIPAGVTIASDRGYNGSTGALLKKTQPETSGGWEVAMLIAGGAGVRVTGCILEGEMYNQDSWGTYPLTEDESNESSFLVGIKCTGNYGSLIVDNCEMRGWAYACVSLYNVSATPKPHIHHNYMHHCYNRGEGYGVSVYAGDCLIEANLFDYLRHSVTGSGITGEKYEARYNIHLAHGNPIGGFHYDVHANENHGSDGLDIAGHTYLIHHNTINQGTGVTQEGFVNIRDNPTVGVYIYSNLINTDWGSGSNDMGFPTPICQAHELSGMWARMFATDNRWKGTVYPGNATIVWYQP